MRSTSVLHYCNCKRLGENTCVLTWAAPTIHRSSGFYSLLISLEITTLPPASFRGASAKTSFLLVGTSKHLASTDPSARISWQGLPRCFREQRFKSCVGSPGASASPQELPRASCFRKTFRVLPRAQRETHFGNHPERSQELFPYLSISRQAPKKPMICKLHLAIEGWHSVCQSPRGVEWRGALINIFQTTGKNLVAQWLWASSALS